MRPARWILLVAVIGALACSVVPDEFRFDHSRGTNTMASAREWDHDYQGFTAGFTWYLGENKRASESMAEMPNLMRDQTASLREAMFISQGMDAPATPVVVQSDPERDPDHDDGLGAGAKSTIAGSLFALVTALVAWIRKRSGESRTPESTDQSGS